MGKWLQLKIDGNDGYIKAFENTEKEKRTDPDYKGEGVAVWENQTQQ